jgi:hypothetical protein
MCSISRLSTEKFIVPQDKTKVVNNNTHEIKKNNSSNNGNNEVKTTLNVDSTLKNQGNSTKNINIIESHVEHHERGVLYKAKEEAIVKTSEKTVAKTSEKLLEKVSQKTALRAGEQILADVAITASV